MTILPRVGLGIDMHRVRPIVGGIIPVCGINIPCDLQIEAHSDGDVGLHAITEALLGASAQGNIGVHFPPSDKKWECMPSSVFVQHAYSLIKKMGGYVVNIDIVIICEQPRIMPYSDAMRNNITNMLAIQKSMVNIKATTTEKMGFLGRGDGIAAQAVCAIVLPE